MRLVAQPSSDKQQNMHCRSTICVLLIITLESTQNWQQSAKQYAVDAKLAVEERRVPLTDFETLVFSHPFALNRPPLEGCDRSSKPNPYAPESPQSWFWLPKRRVKTSCRRKSVAHRSSFRK